VVFNSLEQLLVEDSKDTLCTIQGSNLVICNDISDYCNKYQVEYSEEIKELDDLILFFQTYIHKYNE
jgi:hypothetical protein